MFDEHDSMPHVIQMSNERVPQKIVMGDKIILAADLPIVQHRAAVDSNHAQLPEAHAEAGERRERMGGSGRPEVVL